MGARIELGGPKARSEYCADCPNDESCPVKKFDEKSKGWKEGASIKEMAEGAGLVFRGHIVPPDLNDDGPYDVYICPKGTDEETIGQVKIYETPLQIVSEKWVDPRKRNKNSLGPGGQDL
jgi:hypothetical protein